MSFAIDVNLASPYTTLAQVVAGARANLPMRVTDAEGLWSINSIVYNFRNGKACFEARYTRAGQTSYKWLYYNKPLIGNQDYPALINIDTALFPNLATADNAFSALNAVFWNQLLIQFGFATSGYSVSVNSQISVGWTVSVTVTPAAGPAENPGIKKYIAWWGRKYTDADANVTDISGTPVQSTNITPTYNVEQPGGQTTFQGDFRTKLDALTSAISGGQFLNAVAEAIDITGTAVGDIKDSIVTFYTKIGTWLTGGDGQPSLADKIDGQTAAIQAAAALLAQALQHELVASVGNPLNDLNGQLMDRLATLTAVVDARLDLIEKALHFGASAPSITKAIEDKALTLSAAGIEAKLDAIKLNLQTTQGARMADVLAALELVANLDTTGLQASVDGVGGAVGQVTAKLETIRAELVPAVAQVHDLSAAEKAALLPLFGELAQAAGYASLGAALGPRSSSMAVALLGILAKLQTAGLGAVTTAVAAIDATLSEGAIDLSPEVQTVLGQIRDALAAGLKDGNTAILKQLRDALGNPDIDPAQLPATSIRKLMQSQLTNAKLVNATTGEEVSLAQLIADTTLELKWGKGDLIFRFP